MDISTIIVSYNTYELTVEAISSALLSSPEMKSEIIVVDNNSPDESGRKLSERFADQPDRVRIIERDDNVGFSAANNIGASVATGDVLFFLNPDTVVKPGTLQSLHSFALSNSAAGAIGPLVLNADGTTQASVGTNLTAASMMKFYFPLSAIFRSSVSKEAISPDATCEVDNVKGCAIAMRRNVFDEIGGWDESYFLYAEERELCYACNLNGYKNYFLPEASIIHYGGASTNLEDYAGQQVVQQQSALRFLERHHARSLILLNRVLGSVGFGIRSLTFGVLSLVTQKPDFKRRGEASRKLFAWFLFEYR